MQAAPFRKLELGHVRAVGPPPARGVQDLSGLHIRWAETDLVKFLTSSTYLNTPVVICRSKQVSDRTIVLSNMSSCVLYPQKFFSGK